MLNERPASGCSKKQVTIVLSSTKVNYIALIFIIKKITQIRLLLTKICLLDKKRHYVKIKVKQENKRIEQIKTIVIGQE